MIYLTRLNQIPLVINSDLIEHIEVTPDTVVVLTSGEKYLVLEAAHEVIERVVNFRHSIFTGQTFWKGASLGNGQSGPSKRMTCAEALIDA
jgi:flagellar protein FlbD